MSLVHLHSEVVERNSEIRKEIMTRLFDSFLNMKSGKVLRGALWIAGEYSLDMESMFVFGSGELRVPGDIIMTTAHSSHRESI